ncbi:MAG: D-glycero-beta-D-manno-heptose 1,7-bisphosphate 7-phosphatase [Acidobacteriota bacterium]
MPKAIFLDRDGTLIEEAGYLDRLERLTFFPYSIDAVRLLNRAGYAVVIVTNQAGVARGIFKESFVAEAHRHIRERLAAGGARVDGFYYCPHHPEASVAEYRQTCDCRKPQSGMFTRAAEELDIALDQSFVVGDRWHDLEAGQRVGVQGVLVRTGYGRTEEASPHPRVTPAVIADNLIQAASWILRAS